jgi:hypothetical protein
MPAEPPLAMQVSKPVNIHLTSKHRTGNSDDHRLSVGPLLTTSPDMVIHCGRRLLDSMPYPENPDNHFVVDAAGDDADRLSRFRGVGRQIRPHGGGDLDLSSRGQGWKPGDAHLGASRRVCSGVL